jgi:hypothetical protein
MEQDLKKQILPKTVLFRISSDDRVQVRPAIHSHAHTLGCVRAMYEIQSL